MQNLSKPSRRTDKSDIELIKINIVRGSLKSVVMVTPAQRPCGLQSFLLLYYFLYNRNSTSLKIKLTLLGKKKKTDKKRICKKSKADLKDNKKKKKSAGITNCSPSICPVPVVELYDSVLSMMVKYVGMVACSSIKSKPSH